jgi:serine protease Do
LPEAYRDVASEPWLAATGEPLGYMLTAAPDLAAFRTTWTTPGIVVRTALSLTKTLDAADLLADSDLIDACTAVERSERVHATPVFTYNLLLDTYRGCGGASTYTLAVAQSDPIDHLIFLEFQAIAGADSAALDIFLESFAVDRAANAGAAALAEVAALAPAAPTPTPLPTPAPVLPTGIVLANNLNVRSGPGTEFERLGAAPQGTVLPVAGQLGNCTWLRVTAPNDLEGWVSGDAAFITLDTPCAAIPEMQP